MVQAKGKELKTVGFIGLGAMGSRMVRHLEGVAKLLVFDTDAARAAEAARAVGGTAVASLSGLSKADAVILMLPNSAIIDKVLRGSGDKGLLDVLEPGSIVIDMSSADPTKTIANAALAKERGIALIDAPVSGGVDGAASAKLAIMVGGAQADFERARPILERLGAKVTRVGDVGSGHALKALNNLLAATIFAATSEVFVVGAKFGLDPAIMHEVIDASSGGSFQTNKAWPKAVLSKSYHFGFALQLMEKDVGIGMSIIKATGVETVLAKASAGVWARALEMAPPGADMAVVAQQAERSAGL